MEYSSKHLAYLRRAELDGIEDQLAGWPTPQDLFFPDPASLRLLDVKSICRFWEHGYGSMQGQRYEYRTAEVMAACWASKIPVVSLLLGRPTGIRVMLGTVSTPGLEPPPDESGGLDVIRDCVLSQYPGAGIDQVTDEGLASLTSSLADFRCCGVLMGAPVNKRTEELEDPTQIDRLVRTMQDTDWGLMVIARPLAESTAVTHFNQVIMDMRRVQAAEREPTPMAEEYLKLLEGCRDVFAAATVGGLWSNQVYCFAKRPADFLRLRAAMSLCFGGGDLMMDPIRLVRSDALSEVIPRFGQIVTPAAESPMSYRRPLFFQTSVHSQMLSDFVHLPRQEMPGFIVKDQARFDVAPHEPPGGDAIELGRIIDLGRLHHDHYRVDGRALNKHALVVGVTGSGKTNTIFHLVRSAWRQGIPCLVIEPAKTEYRTLLDDDVLGPKLQVFTIGDETVSPFRINPFEVEAGASIATHIDLLKATFNASFAMWAPLPQVLERALHAVYRDRGWDVLSNRNRRLSAADAEFSELAFPTLTDLFRTTEELVASLGYEERVTSDIRAALSMRLQSLRIGGKGALLDTQHSVPLESVLDRPTIFELEQIGDDEEKAFIMGLILTRIYERHRAQGVAEGHGLSHLIIVEEAHRLLARVPEQSAEYGNPRGKAVETFVNMLSEVRAYGQGFIVAEQIPTKLATDVIKNTNLKIVHRTVAADDRALLAETMNMPVRHSAMLATMTRGEAAVFAEKDDRPIMVKVPPAKAPPSAEMKTRRGSNAVVARRMEGFRRSGPAARAYLSFPSFPDSDQWPGELIEFGKKSIESPVVPEQLMSVVLAALEHPPALPDAVRRLRRYVHDHAPGFAAGRRGFECVAAHAIEWYVTHFGARFDWAYDVAADLGHCLATLVTTETEPDGPAVDGFRETYLAACADATDWTLPIEDIDPVSSAIYRYHTEPLLSNAKLTGMFDQAMSESFKQRKWSNLDAVDEAVARLGGFGLPVSAQLGIATAYGLQQIIMKPGMLQVTRDTTLTRLLDAIDGHYVSMWSDSGSELPSVPSGEVAAGAAP